MSETHRQRAAAGALRATAEAVTLDDLEGEGAGARLLRDALGARLIAVTEFDPEGRPHGRAGDLGECAPDLYFPSYAEDDPITRSVERLNHPVLLTHRHFERAALEASPVYSDYYRPRDIERVLCSRVLAPAYYRRDEGGHLQPVPGLVLVAFFRARSQPEFTAADAQRLARLLPALEALARRGRRVAALGSLLERGDPRARLALDARGTLLWASPSAVALLPGGRRTLPDALVGAARRLAAGEPLGFSVPITGPRGARLHAELSLSRTAVGEPFVVAELVSPPAAGAGLTRAETAVLEALAAGLSNQEIGRRLFISVPTVKTHVHRILGKLGVSSRLQAALLCRQNQSLGGRRPPH